MTGEIGVVSLEDEMSAKSRLEDRAGRLTEEYEDMFDAETYSTSAGERTAFRHLRAVAQRCAEIADQHGDWRTLRNMYPDQIAGAGCDEAHGADLVGNAIRREFNLGNDD